MDKNEKKVLFIILIIICLLRFPQLYGKNYTTHQQSEYFFNPVNLHANVMNTVWTGPTQDYPIKKNKGEVIEGKGQILMQQITNIQRTYNVQADTDIRMADYTFYFPGWKAFIDGKETVIQFQDPSYRGVITYNVPKGIHKIQVKFINTKARLFGMIVTAISIIVLICSIFILKKMNRS